jgi:hypothetical protein
MTAVETDTMWPLFDVRYIWLEEEETKFSVIIFLKDFIIVLWRRALQWMVESSSGKMFFFGKL